MCVFTVSAKHLGSELTVESMGSHRGNATFHSPDFVVGTTTVNYGQVSTDGSHVKVSGACLTMRGSWLVKVAP